MTFTKFQDLYQQYKKKDIKLFETFERISSYLQTLFESESANQISFRDYNLTFVGVTPIGSFPQVENGTFIQIIRQGTGGNQITWASIFQNAPVDIDTTIGTESVFTFIGHNGAWLCVGYRTGLSLSS